MQAEKGGRKLRRDFSAEKAIQCFAFVRATDEQQDLPGLKNFGHAERQPVFGFDDCVRHHGMRPRLFRKERAMRNWAQRIAWFIEAKMAVGA